MFKYVVPKMPDAKVFSTMDGNKGFFAVKLNKESKLFTTINAGPFG